MKQVGTIPWQYKAIKSHRPCESCGYRRSKVKLSLPIKNAPTHRMCRKCAPSKP